MANHWASFNGAPPPDAFIPPFPPEQPPSFSITVTPSFFPTAQAPTVVISIRHHWKYFFMRPMPEGNHVEEHTFSTPPKRFPVPIFLLLTRSRWHQAASGMLSHFALSSEAHTLLLSHLCSHGARWAEDALRHGSTRLDVALDVHERSETEYYPTPFPPPFPTSTDPESMSPLEEASLGQKMKPKELSEIGPGEACAVCLEEFGGSTKVATEIPCSHLFHTDCLLPWLSRATTCPLCRSSLQLS